MPDGTRQADALARKRCFSHASREAAARCPQCRRYYCRECVTEHGGRVICAACLRTLAGRRPAGRRLPAGLGACAAAACGLLAAWVFFYYLGRMLLLIPTSFHEGSMWAQ